MAKIKVTGVSKVQSALRKQITKILRDKETRQGVGEIVVNDIRDTDFGDASKFTKEMREYLEPHNKPLHPKYDPDKIKITFTGELLEDLQNNVRARTTNKSAEYVIEHSNKTHKPYKQPKGKAKKFKDKKFKDTRFDPKTGKFKQTNKQVRVPYKFISTQLIKRLGYNYLKFSSKTEDKLIKFVRKQIFDKLSKLAKK
jgi:hypothetical protein